MKLFLIIITLIFTAVTFGQAPENKSVQSSWDSLHMRHEVTLKFYNQHIESALFETDTLTTKDSIVISKVSKTHLLLQRIVKRHRMINTGEKSLKCVENISEEYYNSRGLIAYVRNYFQPCFLKVDSKDEEIFHAFYYERYEYDEDDNLIMRVFNLPTPKTIKESYTLANGKWTKKLQSISEADFWK